MVKQRLNIEHICAVIVFQAMVRKRNFINLVVSCMK
jgi:hypothetical protein